MNTARLSALAKLVRYYSLVSSSSAGSGHPTSSLSAADLMTVLMFGRFYHFDFDKPENLANDRLIFSKGHASPLYYSLFLAANQITETEIKSLRRIDSPLEGHPTPRFKFTEVATGSLGQGLSIGFGMALAIRKYNENLPSIKSLPRVFVLLGDGEMAEGSVWEAVNLASYYKLNNLTAILDVNRLGQSRETMLGWDTQVYEKRFKAFGWQTEVLDGHNLNQISQAFQKIQSSTVKQPTVIIAKTVKGKGVSFIENKEGWHGKPLAPEDLVKALKELGKVDLNLRGEVAKAAPAIKNKKNTTVQIPNTKYKTGDSAATRKAYGNALARLGEKYPLLVSLDGDVKNSTYAEIFQAKYPGRFFEMFIAEQNMVGAAVGFAKLGYIPFVSTFAAFLTRGFDQIRMAAVSGANIKICGSHAGVSIGEDGPSQMGLEDLAMFRAVNGSTVLYPADAVSTEKLVEEMINCQCISYLRTSRPATSVIYDNNEEFPIGGCKIHLPKIRNPKSEIRILIIAAGVTLFEALKAQEELAKVGIGVTVVDCYSIKPIDAKTLSSLARPPKAFGANGVGTAQVITVEDHWFEGGLGDAVLNVFASDPNVKITKLAVSKMPRSGKPAELLALEGIDAKAIIKAVQTL
ncbi:transketolase [Candidatus Gottesmanbacteria bacterium RIFCSPLOWO2_02_FULL_42_29]|uniref:Transketolase n=2 Tax=Candidatus Gottesmaniibacteriota TaxID=1752720 RepID=A0A1F6BEW5_9BACT|nr:MAG: Transketolase central region [Candidatus Gottesmanbacteria bacterium GW2011_GWA2_42_18]OGG12242.1 MAG: transketolase [Candidatus Gottesmanbacteria bacterium RIFCSPHIGHO2_01_FULL_42_27]OGG21730.1 MAG: transketolase [Candidatus Gottesmanbacteria bacterium RIFCSPHIGHO2_12_FULL_43_26]OGG34729.1 MAG: transketolase [Candidatus Gottesmanbacteria bacterium RIFCSPLOWO2_12_FULL_42_10]OGG35067.1 MAG: transketolase [Candidatus Gottesmanbacteria bacterium RIFCSPLOWO2_01_FULL_42_22]OGG36459.1 MAG: t